MAQSEPGCLSRFATLILFILIGCVVFLNVPGMIVIAVLVDVTGYPATTATLWALATATSIGVVFGIRACVATWGIAMKYYALVCLVIMLALLSAVVIAEAEWSVTYFRQYYG